MSLEWWSAILSPGGNLEPDRAGSETYIALPRRSQPSMLVDESLSRALQTALTRSDATQSSVRTAAGRLAGRALRLGVIRRRLPLAVSVHSRHPTLRDRLEQAVGETMGLAVTAGPVRPNRKPVVRVFGPGEQLRAFAKVAWDPTTDAMVSNELAVLQALAAEPIDGVLVPRVSDHFVWGAHTTLVTEPLPIDPGHASDPQPDPELSMLAAIADHEGRRTSRLDELPYWQELSERLGADAGLLEATQRAGGDAVLAVGRLHGDWSPWNVARPRGVSELVVWDWERSRSNVPIGVDLAHHRFQIRRFLHGESIGAAAPTVVQMLESELSELDVDPAHAAVLVQIELLETLARMNESGLREQLEQRREAIRATLRGLVAW